MDDRLRRTPIGVIETTTNGLVVDADERAATAIDVDPETLVKTDIRESYPRSASGTLRETFRGESVTARSFEEHYPDRSLVIYRNTLTMI